MAEGTRRMRQPSAHCQRCLNRYVGDWLLYIKIDALLKSMMPQSRSVRVALTASKMATCGEEIILSRGTIFNAQLATVTLLDFGNWIHGHVEAQEGHQGARVEQKASKR